MRIIRLLVENLRYRWIERRTRPTYDYADKTLVELERMTS